MLLVERKEGHPAFKSFATTIHKSLLFATGLTWNNPKPGTILEKMGWLNKNTNVCVNANFHFAFCFINRSTSLHQSCAVNFQRTYFFQPWKQDKIFSFAFSSLSASSASRLSWSGLSSVDRPVCLCTTSAKRSCVQRRIVPATVNVNECLKVFNA